MTAPGGLVSDEVEAAVGRTATYVAPEPLSRASIRYFALATGDPNPLWVDDALARRHGWPAAPAPPTLICETCQYVSGRGPDRDGYLGHTWDLPFPRPVRMVRGGNAYRFGAPATAETVLTVRHHLEAIEPRGRLAVVRSVATYHDQHDQWLATNTETLLYLPRDGEGEATEPRRRAAPTASPTGGARRGRPLPTHTRTLELVDLVAYGAATWDWHRLHYDPSVGEAAGLGGPVVDGQLWGALMAKQVVDWAGPAARLGRLEVRYRSVVAPGEAVALRAWAGDDEASGEITHEITADDRLVADGASALRG